MPELPEVESARREADALLRGRTLVSVAVADDDIVFDRASPRSVARALRGSRVQGTDRRGKTLWWTLDRRPWPSFHFGMTGAFHVYRDRAERPRFWKLEVTTDAGDRLAMTNVRRLGRIRLHADPLADPPISALGPDPLIDPLPIDWMRDRLARRNAPIKAVLLDQAFVAGVGNWIADEVLFQARIAPQRRASELSPDEVGRLRRRLLAIIRRACDVGADSDRFPRGWLFHVRWGKVKGARTSRGPVRFDEVGGRTTAWVPTWQR